MDGNFNKVPHKASTNGATCWYDSGNRVLKIMFPKGTYLFSNVEPEFVVRLENEKVSVGTLLLEVTKNPDKYPVTKL